MTPFGKKLKELRKKRNLTLKDQSKFFKLSQSYLSAVENGKKGRPSIIFVDQLCVWLNLIWDEAEELKQLADLSHTNISINTKKLSVEATYFSNLLAKNIDRIPKNKILNFCEKIHKTLEIDKTIIDANPTDGLWDDNRTDEQQIGAKYDEIEWVMQQKEAGKNSDDFKGREREVFEIFEEHHSNNKHKMTTIPTCIIPEELK